MKQILNGFEVRFQYDNTKFQPSNLETNEITDDETQYFKFEDEFKDSLDCFALPYTEKDNVLDWAISFNPPVEESEHIIDDGTGSGTKIVTTAGGVCISVNDVKQKYIKISSTLKTSVMPP